MVKDRKRIALLVGQPDENYQSLFIRGLFEQAFKEDMDVCVFAMYEKYQESEDQEKGDSSIFSLPEYDLFDAVVILGDTIQTPGVMDRIEEELHEKYKKPVICVDRESRFFKTIMTDHYTPVKLLINHLIKEHGLTDIAYLTGKKFHPHSKQRLQGFLDCMEENGLTVGENRVFYGDFWYTSGAGTAEKLLSDREHMPQAIACANDCMAIGLAGELVKAGVRVPEDVAVIGYDMSPEGKTSPKPVTSAPIPARECGIHAIKCIKAHYNREEMPEFKVSLNLFIGSSCGCRYSCTETVSRVRKTWNTESYQESFYSVTDHMGDNLLVQPDTYGLINTVFSSIGPIKPFHRFHICLNSDWFGEGKGKSEVADSLIHVLKCTDQHAGSSRVDIETTYGRKEILSMIMDKEERPKAYFFTPLFFRKRCFGFSAISYGEDLKCYDSVYRRWLGVVMRGLESFRLMKCLENANIMLKAKQVRDSLTGFYNYNGFIENISAMFKDGFDSSFYVEAIAIDIYGLKEISQELGIKGENMVVVDFSNMVTAAVGNGVSCVIGNGEFLVVYFHSEYNEENMSKVQESIRNSLNEYNDENGTKDKLFLVTGAARSDAGDMHSVEEVINDAISIKNGNKAKLHRNMQNKLTGEEQKQAEIVNEILVKNKFYYNFQPIVDAHSGEIFAYEALMRSDTPQFISPLTVLKYAEISGRLYDVQKATFKNVIKYIEDNEEKFTDRKVFINSIPGCRLRGEDAVDIHPRIKKFNKYVVIELTEQAEIGEDEIEGIKADFKNIGVETAVDDYGTGYSNISNLLLYMPDYVKIDRMLLTEIHLSPQKQHFVKEIVEFAHENNIKALAEGIETTEELRSVIELGVDYIQGYYTARPSREVIKSIDVAVRNEIIQYSQLALEKSGQKVYSAGQESKISLVKLATGSYASIQIMRENMTHRDLEIVGVPGFMPDMDIVIGDSYSGRIELQDVELNKHKKHSGISIGENCDVTLVLKGDNIIERGGITVPESSKLTIIGDGNLCMRQIEVEGCGIGNTKDERHGDLYFKQDGAIEIYGNTMHGVGIGSGKGGNINITRGKYIIDLYGQESVGIGTLYGDMNQEIKAADIELNINNAFSLGIGSMEGNVNLSIEYTSVKAYLGGQDSVGIGTFRGGECSIKISEASALLNLRANESACGIGSLTNKADLDVSLGAVNITTEGKNAIAMGSLSRHGEIHLVNAVANSKVRTNLDIDIGADVIEIVNGRGKFLLNGEEILREVIEGEL